MSAGWVATLPASDEVSPEIEDQSPDPRRAHVKSAWDDPSASCVRTEADTDADVFKRPCFVQKLSKSRQSLRAFEGLMGGGIRVAGDRIPEAALAELQRKLARVIAPDVVPANWTEAPFFGVADCPLKTITERRNGVETFVGFERDCTQRVTELSPNDIILAEWAWDGLDVLPCGRYMPGGCRDALCVRLRLHGKDRLELLAKPTGFGQTTPRDRWWHYFDRPRFHDLLTKIFRVPFKTPDDYYVRGYEAEYEGVRVFHGAIVSQRRKPAEGNGDAQAADAPPWWDEIRLLVTDSDPQYFCVRVIVRENEE